MDCLPLKGDGEGKVCGDGDTETETTLQSMSMIVTLSCSYGVLSFPDLLRASPKVCVWQTGPK